MKPILSILLAILVAMSARADKFDHLFWNTPLPQALMILSKNHPELTISFIYKDLENYQTSARVDTDDPYKALRLTIGLNPVTITQRGEEYFLEALQHGKYHYTGRIVASDNRGVEAATVMLLNPSDSTVLTYGITDSAGRFSIPCDRKAVIAKVTCLGYKPLFRRCDEFYIGILYMTELPVNLKNIDVKGDDALLLADRSVYLPSKQQKNASQSATDLLARMAIPQLDVRLGSANVSTAGGEPVALYIDYVPATADELKMMRMDDVRSVEFLEYPVDPRFQGNRYVVNFRMIRYEYGGYVKVLATEDFIANSGSMQGNARFVKGRMTYDVMGYGYYMENDHLGTDETEYFRLPQDDGSLRSFERRTSTDKGRYSNREYAASFRALYYGDKVTANSQVAGGIDNTPRNLREGSVGYSYAPETKETFNTDARLKERYLRYNGYYFFSLPKDNALTADLSYMYAKTAQNSGYTESAMAPILNQANDVTHEGNITVDYTHVFSTAHSLNARGRLLLEQNLTDYSGSVDARDKSITRFAQLGVGYNYSGSNLSGSVGAGWNRLSTSLNQNDAVSHFPYIDASLSYRFDKRNYISGVFHYSVWPPSSNYKSENVIHVSPYLWYTGNPVLKSHRAYDIWLNYSYIASPKFRMTLFGGTCLIGNRAAFVYNASAEGIVRTLRQPIGSFGYYNYGVNISSRFAGDNLYLSGRLEHGMVKNGKPYDVTRSLVSYYLQAIYYLGKFNFAVSYQSKKPLKAFDSMSGIWSVANDQFIVQAGWSNGKWNVVLSGQNFQRWNWRSSFDVMNSEYYSFRRWENSATAHAFVRVQATYTFGYGKKVKRNDELNRQGGASSGILK